MSSFKITTTVLFLFLVAAGAAAVEEQADADGVASQAQRLRRLFAHPVHNGGERAKLPQGSKTASSASSSLSSSWNPQHFAAHTSNKINNNSNQQSLFQLHHDNPKKNHLPPHQNHVTAGGASYEKEANLQQKRAYVAEQAKLEAQEQAQKLTAQEHLNAQVKELTQQGLGHERLLETPPKTNLRGSSVGGQGEEEEELEAAYFEMSQHGGRRLVSKDSDDY